MSFRRAGLTAPTRDAAQSGFSKYVTRKGPPRFTRKRESFDARLSVCLRAALLVEVIDSLADWVEADQMPSRSTTSELRSFVFIALRWRITCGATGDSPAASRARRVPRIGPEPSWGNSLQLPVMGNVRKRGLAQSQSEDPVDVFFLDRREAKPIHFHLAAVRFTLQPQRHLHGLVRFTAGHDEIWNRHPAAKPRHPTPRASHCSFRQIE